MLIFLGLIAAHLVFVYARPKLRDAFGVYVLVDLVLMAMFGFGLGTMPDLRQRAWENQVWLIGVPVGILSLYLGLHWSPAWARIPLFPASRDSHGIRPKRLYLVAGAYVLLASVELWLTAARYGYTFIELFTREKLTSYLHGGILDSHALLMAREFFFPGVLVLLFYEMDRRHWIRAGILLSIPLAVHIATATSRLGMLVLLGLPACYYHFRIRRIALIVVLATFIPFATVMTFLNFWRNVGFEQALTAPLGEGEVFENISRDFNPLNGMDYIFNLQDHDALPYEYGRNYYYCFLTFVPRAVWPQKPLTAFEPRWTEISTGYRVGEGTPIWTFTAWGEGMAQFGYLGIALNLFLFGFVLQWTWRQMGWNAYFVPVQFFFTVLGATYLRGGFQALFFASLMYTAELLFLHRFVMARRVSTAVAEEPRDSGSRQAAPTFSVAARTR